MSELNKTYLSAEQMEDGLWPSHMLDDVFLIPSDLINKNGKAKMEAEEVSEYAGTNCVCNR